MTELQRKLQVTTIMVTHDQEEALSMADRIVVMNHGVIEQVGTPTEIYTNPISLFVADFIGEMNQMPAEVLGADRVKIGDKVLHCDAGALAAGTDAIVVIRPEDVFPVEKDTRAPPPENALLVHIDAMEFLGSFWRTHLSTTELGGQNLIADFSINAVRRLEMREGADLLVEMRRSSLKAFDSRGGAAR
jgi:iron(III) transport system ATP-binding protein